MTPFPRVPRARRLRYELLRVAQRILYTRGAEPALQARTCWCHRSITSKWNTVGVYRRKDGSGARYAGVTTCGAVWTCPVCSAKIAEHRRRELSAAMVYALKIGLHGYLFTLTFPHEAGEALLDLLVRQAKALQSFKNSRTYKNFMKAHARLGSVRGLEATVGSNGWHPHTHDLIFAAPGMLADHAGIRRLRCAWLRACLKAGLIKPNGTLKPLRDFWRHSMDLCGGDRAAEYIAKYGRDERWGISSEVTANHAKVGLRKAVFGDDMHFTPFQLLEWAKNGDASAAALFREYAKAFEGKRMLSWSPKLKSALGIRDLTDEEIAAASEVDPSGKVEEEYTGEISGAQYGVLLSRNALGEFLDFVRDCCVEPRVSMDAMNDWIRALEKERPPAWGSAVKKKTSEGIHEQELDSRSPGVPLP